MRIVLPDRTIAERGSEPASIEEVLKDLGINPLEVMVTHQGRLIPEDAILEGDEEIRLIRISHGG
jgi:sulfur carrier protein